jgi:NarL family two-component system response regulator LiaR
MNPIRVLIVDDHAVVRDGLPLLLGSAADIEVVATAASAEEGIERARALAPSLVLLDLIMPGMSGIEAIPPIKTALPDVRVLMLTSYVDGDLVAPALQAGADGYLLKTAAGDEVLDAVRAVAAGRRVIDPEADRASRESDLQDLSVREREVLHLVAEGYSNAEIAERLSITVRTVKAHISSLLQKLHLSDRTQLAIHALKRSRRA